MVNFQTAPSKPKHDKQFWTVVGVLIAVVSAVLAYLAWQYPRQPEPTPPPSGRAAYIAQADALCDPAVRALNQQGDYPQGQENQVVWLKKNIAILEGLFRRWSALRFPDADEAQVRSILDTFTDLNVYNTKTLNNLQAAIDIAYGRSGPDPGDVLQRQYLDAAYEQREIAIQNALKMDKNITAYHMNACAQIVQT